MDTHEQEDEPQTPMWLPILGIALFLIAGIWWATRPVPTPPQPPPPSLVPAPSASAPAAHSAR